MKINPGLPPVRETTMVRPAARASTTAQVAAPASVEVSLSGSLRPEIGTTEAPVDAAKVARLRLAIQDGSYQSSAANIADKMLAHSQLELRKS